MRTRRLPAAVLGLLLSLAGAMAATPAACEEVATEPIATARPGAIVVDHGLELSEAAIPRIAVTRTPGEKVGLLLSDKPEYFRTGDGIAMRETVPAGR